MENRSTENKNKELSTEIAKLKRQIETLKKNRNYGLIWEKDKEPEKIVLDCQYKIPILNEVKEKAIINDKNLPENILIEGDNYHALSVLNYTHLGKIDIIYIDPPYNTGNNDFIYNDKYVDAEDAYKHSKWLSFMEKRLSLAKNLLKDSGIIFISINNIELAQLKLLCDEVFNGNFIGIIIWRNKTGGGKQGQDIEGKREKKEALNTDHEYILVYSKNGNKVRKLEESLSKEEKNVYINIDNDPRGKYKLRDMEEAIPGIRENNYYEIKDPDGIIIKPGGGKLKWRFVEKEFKRKLKDKSIIWIKRKCKTTEDKREYYYRPMVKQYLYNPEEGERTKILRSIFYNIAYTADGTNELKQIFEEGFDKFQFPKPSKLIKKLIGAYYNKNAVVLDFFAGTGTTGHAVLEMNKEDGGNRKFILCTNNEGNICTEITYPRIKNVINGYNFHGEEKTNIYEKELTSGSIKNLDDIKYEIVEIIKKSRSDFDAIKTEIKNNVIYLVGIKKIKGRKNGLRGNLRYFKTELLDVDHISHVSDDNKIKLTYKAGSMIALREDTFEEIEKNDWWQIFKNHKKYTAIYFKEDKQKLRELVKKLSNLQEEVKLYIFSWGKNEYKNEFTEYKNINVEDIPEPIIEVYKEVNSLN